MTATREERRIDREIHRTGDGSDPFAAAVRATRMPMLITDPRQDDNPIVFMNDAFSRLTGYTREETIGNNCRFLQGPETDRGDVGAIRDAVARRVPIEIELLNYRKDGTTFWNRVLISPVFDGDELVFFFASQFDVTHERNRMASLETDRSALELELERRVGELTDAEERLRYTLQAGNLGSWRLDLSDNRLLGSALLKQIFGRGPADSFSYSDWCDAILPADRDRWFEAVDHAISTGKDLDVEFRITMSEAQIHWIEARGKTNYRAEGSPLGITGVALDVTSRKVAEGHRDLLTRELDHRVKNTLANVQSLVHQSLAEAESLGAANGLISARLGALAAAHDVLTRRGWERAPLTEIVDAALAPFRNKDATRFRLGGPSIYLHPRAVTAVSIALHELATNAVKYGALSNDTGFVILNWSIERDQLFLRWQEEGGPPVSPPARKGFGSRMIERALAAELEGRGQLTYREKGVVFDLVAPLGDLADPPPPKSTERPDVPMGLS